ncbi:hypothetical protein Bca101_019767 [Brassica carinata]
MTSGGDGTSHPPFPPRMFAVGDEPLGIRVTPYQKPSAITKILNALTGDEVEVPGPGNITAGNHPNTQPPADVVESPVPPVCENAANSNDTAYAGLDFSRPTFSLGLTKEDPRLNKVDLPDVYNGDEHKIEGPAATSTENKAPAPPYRRSKHPRVIPRALVGDYQCGKRILTRA